MFPRFLLHVSQSRLSALLSQNGKAGLHLPTHLFVFNSFSIRFQFPIFVSNFFAQWGMRFGVIARKEIPKGLIASCPEGSGPSINCFFPFFFFFFFFFFPWRGEGGNSCLSGCLFVCLSVCLSGCLFVWLSVCLAVCLSGCLFVWQGRQERNRIAS